MLTVNEVAERLKLTPYTIYEWIKKGRLSSAVKLPNGEYRISEVEVERLLTPNATD